MANRSSVKDPAASGMSLDEKIELIELLEEMTPPDFKTRERRFHAAERRLGMWENGKFTGRGLAELIWRARRHDTAAGDGNDDGQTFTEDEFAVLNAGFRNHQEIEDAEHRQGAPSRSPTASRTIRKGTATVPGK